MKELGRMDERQAFAEYVRSAREALGLTQRALAAQAGISHAYIGGIETGGSLPPGEGKLRAVAEVLGIDADDLVIRAARCFPAGSNRARIGQLLVENSELRRTAS